VRRGSFTIGYCTNVHAGASLLESCANLEQHALEVKRRVSPHEPMGVGLWLSAATAQDLVERDAIAQTRDWLAQVGLIPFTLNGFPYGNFHQEIVKHRVYEPTWADPLRLEYTNRLVSILHELLPAGADGSISTLPLQWGHPKPDQRTLEQSAANLRAAAANMASLLADTGRLIHLCIEPEPGCVFDRAQHIVDFFEQYLLPGGREDEIRRHIRVCHDVCHAAVMFEDQVDVLERYRSAGIEVGKIQVSAAVIAPFDSVDAGGRQAMFDQLSRFNEPRYLHQTVIRRGGQETFYEDLPPALAAEKANLTGEWRTHFHVPVYLERFGHLQASHEQISQCLANFGRLTNCKHLEVETYAWGVLPQELHEPSLAAGIAKEMAWLDAEMSRQGCYC
jgi:hypothetical protein